MGATLRELEHGKPFIPPGLSRPMSVGNARHPSTRRALVVAV